MPATVAARTEVISAGLFIKPLLLRLRSKHAIQTFLNFIRDQKAVAVRIGMTSVES
jgi:hypothetical protein